MQKTKNSRPDVSHLQTGIQFEFDFDVRQAIE